MSASDVLPSLVVTALVAAGLFLSWAARVQRSRIDLRAIELWFAVLAAICLGIAVGRFYALLDFPVIWP